MKLILDDYRRQLENHPYTVFSWRLLATAPLRVVLPVLSISQPNHRSPLTPKL
ncbi:hypothetical protein WKK05_10465 [Nostoc sp. UHCC 0302]|uniref:hypothetical protein n=1 Tax=Nostoc sp. UHCC 0302 TaxID=3134896 RepID=UPI00311CB4C8